MPYELKSLRHFVAVAEAGSVGKAAQQLHMAQPPLSVHIRKLEAQIGAALFHREPSGMRLTDARMLKIGDRLQIGYTVFEAQ